MILPRGLPLAVLLVAGCATAPVPLPAHLADPVRSPHPDCPPARFMVEAASSDSGRADAEARARAAVARRISSAIAVETERVAEISRADGIDHTSKSLRQTIHERASFRHAELIQIVGAPVERGGQSWALACLDRERALDAVRGELEAPLARFEGASERATVALDRKDRPGFTQAFNESVGLETQLLPRFAEIRAIAAAPSPAEKKVAATIRELHQAAGRLRGDATVRIQLRADGIPTDLRDSLTESFRGAVASMGLRTVVDRGDRCDAGSHRLRVDVEPSCRWGSLGHSCRPKVVVDAEDCDASRVVFQASLDEVGQGNDAREVERALRKALARLDQEKLKEKLRELFAAELPLAGP